MANIVEQLKLAEKAQEDTYFAKINRRLIKALHEQCSAQVGIGHGGNRVEIHGERRGGEFRRDSW